jgi:hypothetical protein
MPALNIEQGDYYLITTASNLNSRLNESYCCKVNV